MTTPRTARRRLVRAAACLALAGAATLPGGAVAQTASPGAGRPLRIVVPSTAGGGTDAYARVVGEAMGRGLGRPVLIDNRPSAAGILASETVARATPDGNTLLVGTTATMTINPSTHARLPYQVDDFAPLCQGVGFALVLVVPTSLEVGTVAGLADWLRGHPDRASYASYQPGTPSHFVGHQFGERIGVTLTHVPYKGSAPQVVDLAAGVVPFGFTQLQTALPQLREGRLRALATTGAQRDPALPDVPTLAEAGLAELTTTAWFGLFAPKATPPDALARLIDAHRRAFAEPAVRDRLAAQGLRPLDACGDRFAATLQSERARWGAVVRATGFSSND